jgi:hypothetical protein
MPAEWTAPAGTAQRRPVKNSALEIRAGTSAFPDVWPDMLAMKKVPVLIKLGVSIHSHPAGKDVVPRG